MNAKCLALLPLSMLVVACSVAGRGADAEPHSPARHWGGQRLVDVAGAYGAEPRLALDAQGNAAIAWRQHDAQGRSRVWVTLRDAGGGASLPAEPVSAAGQDVLAMDIAATDAGDVFVAWHARIADAPVVCLTRLVAKAQQWAPAQCLPAPGADGTFALGLVAHAAGRAVVVWGEAGALMASRFDASRQRWSDPSAIVEAPGQFTSPQVRLDQDADPFVVWQQAGDGTRGRVYSSRYDTTVGRWTAPLPVDPASEGDQSEPRMAIDSDGHATVVWLQRQGARSELMAARHEASERRFGAPVQIATDAGMPDLVVDSVGNATVAWSQVNGDLQSVRVRRLPGSLQSADEAVTVATGPLNTMKAPSVAVDARGSAVVVWTELRDVIREHVFAARFDAHRGTWQPPVQIGAQARGFGTGAKVALAPQGAGLAVWAGYRVVRANTFR